jgi:hypothetical protein
VFPLVFRGYTSTAGDGGVGIIDGNGGAIINGGNHIHWRDMELRNGGSSTLISTGASCSIRRCRIADTSGIGVSFGTANCLVTECEITDCGEGVVAAANQQVIANNYFRFGSTRNFTNAVKTTSTGLVVCERNIFSMGTSGTAVFVDATGLRMISNSVLANGSTGAGVVLNSIARAGNLVVVNNIIEGFSGSGGRGFSWINTTTVPLQYSHNAAYNNATNYHQVGDFSAVEDIDNEVLSASPFAKSGSDTFANRYVYFAPVDTGNIRGGAIQYFQVND